MLAFECKAYISICAFECDICCFVEWRHHLSVSSCCKDDANAKGHDWKSLVTKVTKAGQEEQIRNRTL